MSLQFKIDITPPCKPVEYCPYYSSSWMISANDVFDNAYMDKYLHRVAYNPLQAAFKAQSFGKL